MKNLIIGLLLLAIIVLIYLNSKSSFTPDTPELNIIYDLYKNRFQKRFLKNTLNGKLAGLDMVYVINMPMRKEYISKQISKLGVNCTYFDAV